MTNRDKLNEALDLLRDISEDRCHVARTRAGNDSEIDVCNPLNCKVAQARTVNGFNCRLCIARKTLYELLDEDCLDE